MHALYKELLDTVENFAVFIYFKETDRPIDKQEVVNTKKHLYKLVDRLCGYICYHGRN